MEKISSWIDLSYTEIMFCFNTLLYVYKYLVYYLDFEIFFVNKYYIKENYLCFSYNYRHMTSVADHKKIYWGYQWCEGDLFLDFSFYSRSVV